MLKQEQYTTLERKIERFTKMLEERPKDGLTVLALAEASFRRGLKLEALTAYQQVTKEQPVPEAYLAVAEIYSQQNMTGEAYGELRRLFELDPENVEARLLANELQSKSPAPDDVARTLNEPTSDEAFDEARLRLQIQRAIHNRELQERTRNVTLEPGVVIHEYYVEEAKKKLIDVDEQLRKIEDLRVFNATLREMPRPEPIAPEPEIEVGLETEADAAAPPSSEVDLLIAGGETSSEGGEVEVALPETLEPSPDFASSLPGTDEAPQPEVSPIEPSLVDYATQEQADESVPDFSESAPVHEADTGETSPIESVVTSGEEAVAPVEPALPPVEEAPPAADPPAVEVEANDPPVMELTAAPPIEMTSHETPLQTPENPEIQSSSEESGLLPIDFHPPNFSADGQTEASGEELTSAPIEFTTEPESGPALDTGMDLVTNVEPDLPEPDEAIPEVDSPALPELPSAPDFSNSPGETEAPAVIEIGLDQSTDSGTPDAVGSFSSDDLELLNEPVAPVPDMLEPISVESGIVQELPEPTLPELEEQSPEFAATPDIPPVPTPEPMPIQMGDPVQFSEPEVPEASVAPEPELPAEPEIAPPPEEEAVSEAVSDLDPETAASNGALAAERQAFYLSQAEELGKLTATLARTRGVTSIFLCSRDGTTIDSVVKDDVTEARIGELVLESFDFLTAYAQSPAYWVLECGGGIFVMQALDDFHVLIAIGQAGANFGALRYTMDKTKAKFGAILKDVPR